MRCRARTASLPSTAPPAGSTRRRSQQRHWAGRSFSSTSGSTRASTGFALSATSALGSRSTPMGLLHGRRRLVAPLHHLPGPRWGSPIGLLAFASVAAVPRSEWDTRGVRDTMISLDEVPLLTEDGKAVDALVELPRRPRIAGSWSRTDIWPGFSRSPTSRERRIFRLAGTARSRCRQCRQSSGLHCIDQGSSHAATSTLPLQVAPMRSTGHAIDPSLPLPACLSRRAKPPVVERLV
jgi:hypothetical protein